MSLTSIITSSQTGSLDLLATQYTDLPSLANTSGEAIKIAITTTGHWYLVKPDFATNDPSLVKYKTPVDGDGYARDQNQKFNFKYPQLNPGALVAEIKDAQGNTKSTVSGKQQNFELQPGDTASFIINDDPKWYSNNAGKLTIGYSTTPITPNPLKPTPLVAIADLYNTGVDNDRRVLGDSISDPHYTLATYPAGTVTPGVTTPNKDLAPINWVANTQTARWIGPNTTSATGPVGDYSYKTTFTLPSFSEALIVGELSVDDWITDILINGVSLGNPVPLSSWTNIRKFSISKGFVVGTNTIEFKLHSVGGPTGLRIDSISGTYRPPVATAKAGNPVINREIVDTAKDFYLVDTNNSVNVNGNLTSWQIWAKNTLPVQLVMYRRNGTAWSVVGKSDIKTPVVGANSFNLPTPIQVKAGDFVGLYHPQQGSVAFTFSLNGPDSLGPQNFTGSVLYGFDSATNFASSSNRLYSLSVEGPAQ